MPGSSTLLDKPLVEDLQMIQPKTVYEFGVGRGRISNLIKKTVPSVHLTGFEIFPDYVRDHQKTLKVCDEIVIADMYDWVNKNVDWVVDVVVACDVLEHLPLSKAIDFIDNVRYRCKYIIIKTPLAYPQNTEFGNLKEAHICELPLRKLINYDIRKYIVEVGDTGWMMAYYLIKGWL